RRLGRLARCGAGPIQRLLDKGLARRISRRIENRQVDETLEVLETSEVCPTLNADQSQAWTLLEAAIDKGGFQPFLLYGVTGSGKTELYLRAIEEVIRQGKEALVLVPEISLTPQTIQAFRGRCGDVAVLHSHLHSAERSNHWRRIARGQVKVIAGARS